MALANELDANTNPNAPQANNREIDIRAIKSAGLDFIRHLDTIASHSPNLKYSRELSLAKTKIEEAVMWAVKNITD